MSFAVRADPVFWRIVDEIDNPVLLDDVYDTLFRLVEHGIPPNAPDVEAVVPPVIVQGHTIDLPGGSGFIVAIRPETLSHDYIYVTTLIFYDWEVE